MIQRRQLGTGGLAAHRPLDRRHGEVSVADSQPVVDLDRPIQVLPRTSRTQAAKFARPSKALPASGPGLHLGVSFLNTIQGNRHGRHAMIEQHSKAGAAAKGVPNVAAVRKPLHRSRASAILSVPGRPKGNPGLTVTEGSYLIGSCDGGGARRCFSPSARESAETKMEGVSYAAFV